MKKVLVFIVVAATFLNGFAQNWSPKITSLGEKPTSKTLPIRKGNTLVLGISPKQTGSTVVKQFYTGTLLGATSDSVTISLKSVRINRRMDQGVTEDTNMPAAAFLGHPAPMDNAYKMAIADIQHLQYQSKRYEYGEAFELGLLLSAATLLISPFICINYGDMTFNAERYKYWALGGTAGIVASFTYAIVMYSGMKRYYFRSDWTPRGKKTWTFR
jgi:hypothetical protein